ncbi:MAG: thiamine pyrophosphate-binding protein [Rhodospirillales bacterium]|nr:thiamine pyrophosphate-binding protein [Rhodospirillales bacterium]
MATARTGGRLIVDALLNFGVERIFGVPGESYLAILDALYDVRARIAFITCRHEHGAAMMAEADGKLTGRPGVCLVTRGPGACNAAIGVHTARQDSTPMVLLVGQVERARRGRESFQEVDFEVMFRPLAKRVEEIESAAALPEALARAFHTAMRGRPGPVVLSLPQDVLGESAVCGDAPMPRLADAPPDPGVMERIHRVLGDSLRPVLLLGGSGWNEAARADIERFAEANALPVCCGFRRHDLFDNNHPCFVGELGIGANPALVARVRSADVLLAVGSRLDEATTQGFSLLAAGGPELVHVHPGAQVIGRVFPAAIALCASAPAFAASACKLAPSGGTHRRAWTDAARSEYLADTAPAASGGGLDLGQAMIHLRTDLPGDAIVTVDAGNFSGWPQRYLRFGGGRRLLGAVNGAMGYGVPAAVAAKLRYPQRLVVACAGDGGFGMTGQELATAVQHGAAPIVIVFDNGMYGTIRMHQERAYPRRPLGTGLQNPDFVAFAHACGAFAERVEHTSEFAPALARAKAAGRAAVLVLAVDPDAISTRTTLARLRASSP